jgi:hypothetical protein
MDQQLSLTELTSIEEKLILKSYENRCLIERLSK